MRDTQRYLSLPFNSKLKQRAKELRKAGMLHEALLWNRLKRKQLAGLDFDRQKIIGNYIVDFFCGEKSVVIEADGATHQGREDYDAERDAYLNGLGLTVIRIAVKDILQNMENVISFLENHPALSGTPPQEGNKAFGISETPPPQEGNEAFGISKNSPLQEGNNASGISKNSPPLEGWQAKPDGVVGSVT